SPGPLEIVRNEVDGLIVGEHTATAVAEALEVVLTDHQRRASMAVAAREAAQRFALPAIAGQYDSWFSELVACTPVGSACPHAPGSWRRSPASLLASCTRCRR